MDKLELRVFRVGNGMSVALIERPENYLTLVDLGADSGFTPLKYLSLKLKLKPDVLYITHPHAEHLYDVETALDKDFRPRGLHYETYDWRELKKREREKEGLEYKVDKFVELQKVVPYKNYGGNASLRCWGCEPDNAKEHFGKDTYVNNSSLFLVYQWRDFKIAIAGDLESNCMADLIGTSAVQDAASGASILIPPHHGHMKGFPTEWVEKMGKPQVSIISTQERDKSVDPRYASSDFANGVKFRDETRYALNTWSDGHILVEMWYGSDDNPRSTFEPF